VPASYDAEELNRRFAAIAERMGAIEAQLAILSEKAGVPYEPPSANAPPEVVELVRAGRVLDAITRYRELTGASLEEARAMVDGI
jgi:ribosomal protein L7/L12